MMNGRTTDEDLDCSKESRCLAERLLELCQHIVRRPEEDNTTKYFGHERPSSRISRIQLRDHAVKSFLRQSKTFTATANKQK